MAPFWDFTFKRKRVAIGIPLEEEAVGIPPDFTIIRPSAFLTTVWTEDGTSDFKIYCSKFPTNSTVKSIMNVILYQRLLHVYGVYCIYFIQSGQWVTIYLALSRIS